MCIVARDITTIFSLFLVFSPYGENSFFSVNYLDCDSFSTYLEEGITPSREFENENK